MGSLFPCIHAVYQARGAKGKVGFGGGIGRSPSCPLPARPVPLDLLPFRSNRQALPCGFGDRSMNREKQDEPQFTRRRAERRFVPGWHRVASSGSRVKRFGFRELRFCSAIWHRVHRFSFVCRYLDWCSRGVWGGCTLTNSRPHSIGPLFWGSVARPLTPDPSPPRGEGRKGRRPSAAENCTSEQQLRRGSCVTIRASENRRLDGPPLQGRAVS
jgi:hypothetical protein